MTKGPHLSQVIQILTLLKDKRMTDERLAGLLASGALADLLDPSILPSRIDRKKLREVISFGPIVKEFLVEISYATPSPQLMKLAENRGVTFRHEALGVIHKICRAETTPRQTYGSGHVALVTVCFGDEIKDGKQAVKKLEEMGLLPANGKELFEFAMQYPDELTKGEGDLVPAGSTWDGKALLLTCPARSVAYQPLGNLYPPTTRFLAFKKAE